MNTKNLFTFAGITYVWYAFILTVAPQGLVDSVYPNMSESNLNLYYGGALFGLAMACLMVRSQPPGAGITALLVAITIEQLTAVYVHVGSMLDGGITPVDIVDITVSLIVCGGGAYLLMQSRKSQHATAGLIILGAMSMSACADSRAPAVDASVQDDLTERLEAHLDAFEVSWSAGDGETLGSLYAEDAIRISSAEQTPLYGRQEIAAHYSDRLAGSEEQARIELTLVDSRSLGSNLLLAVGEYQVSSAEEAVSRRGTWINLLDVSGDSFRVLFDNASSATALEDFSQVNREMDPLYTGENSDAIDRAIVQYLGFLHASDFASLTAASFVADGMQVMDGRMLIGREAMVAGIQPLEPGASLQAYGYGYRPVSEDVVLAWGPYEVRDANDDIIGFGQWGNVLRLVDGELVIIVEAGGAYAGS